jgi:GT2 family glycosyltransferase
MRIPENFDAEWYAKAYPDVMLSGLSPADHYFRIGLLLMRPPNAESAPLKPMLTSRRFDWEAYRLANPDVPGEPYGARIHRALHPDKVEHFTNWLDFHLEDLCGREQRIRISSLIDLLLESQDRQSDSPLRAKNLAIMKDRLVASLMSYREPCDKPKVTVVVPVYNQVFYTLACAISLFESRPNMSFELVIADDCSTDETTDILSSFSPAIRIVKTSGNVGFLQNCNHAAETAHAEFIVMLNNDTIVLPSWLDALVDTLEHNDKCGMVGSKLLSLNGTLQEAGAIYWRDGSAWNFGRNQDQRAPQFCYLKEVDYCSGASICLRTEIWNRLGGFDQHFAPAYCEEVDLAFRLREKLGLTTIYQPRSVLVHHEGVSHGTDVAQGIKNYQVVNQRKLLDRWKEVLERDHLPNGQCVFLARDRSRKKPRMLFVDHYVPTPDCDAGSRQMDAYLKLFAKMGFQITFWPDNLARDAVNGPIYEQLGIEVMSAATGHIQFEEWIREHGEYLQVAFLSRPHIAVNYLEGLKTHAPTCLRVFYGHDLHIERIRREMNINPSPALEEELLQARRWEEACWEHSDIITYPSQEECDFVAQACPGKRTHVLPLYCVNEAEARRQNTAAGFEQRTGLLFVGGFNHRPNADAVIWFVHEILPIVQRKLPDVEFIVAGANPPSEVLNLEKSHNKVRVTGRISDEALGAFYNQARVAVAPLRFGAGVKGKVVESLMKGLPMVTTSVGTQGLSGVGEGLSYANEPLEFASRIVELYTSRTAWENQRQRGQSFFAKSFLESSIHERLAAWLPAVSSPHIFQ